MSWSLLGTALGHTYAAYFSLIGLGTTLTSWPVLHSLRWEGVQEVSAALLQQGVRLAVFGGERRIGLVLRGQGRVPGPSRRVRFLECWGESAIRNFLKTVTTRISDNDIGEAK